MTKSKNSVVPTRKAFERYLKSGNATLGSVLENYGRGNFDCGMLRVSRLIRQECLAVPGVLFGVAIGDKVTDGAGSGKLCDELVNLADDFPDRKIVWIKAPK